MSKDFYNTRDSYKLYKEKSNALVGIKDYLKIAGLYMKFLIRKVLLGELIVLPGRLGNLSVTGKKQKIRFDEDGKVIGLAPDWVKTKKLWDENPQAKADRKVLYHTNPETSGIRYKFLWSKKHMLVKNKTLYSLKLTRTNKRTLSDLIKQGKEYVTT